MPSFIITKKKVNSMLVISLIFFFPFVIMFNYLFDIREGYLSILFRFLNLIISLIIILYALYLALSNKFQFSLNKYVLILFFFYFIYLLRLFVDLELNNLYTITSYSKSYYYMYFVGISILPGFAILLLKDFDFSDFFKRLKHLLIVFNILIFIFYIITVFIEKRVIFRFWLIKDDFEFLNPITIGSYSSLLLILIHRNVFKKLKYFLLFNLCLINLLIAGSKGPMVSFLVVFFLSFLFNSKYYFKNSFEFLSKIVFLFLMIISLFIVFGESLISRFANLSSDLSTQIRSSVFQNAIDQFCDNSFFGSHFLVLKSKMYSHNIIMDILLATGIFGFVLLLPVFYKAFSIFWKDRFSSPITLIFLYLFIMSFFSGSIYSSSELFLCFLLLMNTNNNFQINNRQ
jgi:hypothetical protein